MNWHTDPQAQTTLGLVGVNWHSWTSPYPTEAETMNTYTINDTALGQQYPIIGKGKLENLY